MTADPLYWRLVKFGFRLLYNEMAFTYDSVSWIFSLGEWRSWQQAALKHLNVKPGARVLELAHGTGNLQIDLRAAGLDSVALDFSPFMGSIARRKLLRRRLTPRLLRARAQNLPFADESVPVIVSTFPTNFAYDPHTIAEVYRVLQPGGRFVCVPNGELSGNGLIHRALEFAYRVTGQRGSSPIQLDDRFEAVGFTLTQLTEPCKSSKADIIIAHKPN
jgi:ubiquinone/menaquinone biosynthesis C-methylase UbiE